MGIKLNINDISKDAKKLYGFKLLSEKYINNSTPLLWEDINTGIQFKRSWNAIKHGQTSVGNPSKKLGIEYVRSNGLKKFGYKLLTETYINSHTPMEWMDVKTGKKFFRSWANLEAGFTGTYNLNDYETDKKIVENYESLGYQLDMSEEEYLQSKTLKGIRLLRISNKKYNINKLVTKAQFLRNAHKYITREGISSGECIVEDLLIANGITYEREKSVTIKGKNHKFDFYIPSYSLFIEYDGQQHFMPIEAWGGEDALNRRIERDNLKNSYVESINKSLVRVPYTCDTYDKVANVINKESKLLLRTDIINKENRNANT